MAETYTGTEGTEAFNDGMTVLDGTEDRRDGWLAINKARDYIVTKTAAALTAAKAYTDQKVGAISLTWNAITGKPSSFPPSTHSHSEVRSGGFWFGWLGNDTWGTGDHLSVGRNLGVDGIFYGKTVRLTEHVYVPEASAATSGYTVAYINSDGRLSRGASSERYKTDITDAPDLGDLFAAPLRQYRMRQDGAEPPAHPVDDEARIGYIAEELLGTPMERFVVYLDGQVESIDFIALLMAQNHQLHTDLDLLAQRLTALEEAAS
ncbi:hypothetical protein [Microbacterium sp.]|uniref:hypothetical protein n=1 Tax=Microbacterium sp. TaxID=51671 RepID=UPI002810B04A|nr:hypothetical protein [Microbacterium sp.]